MKRQKIIILTGFLLIVSFLNIILSYAALTDGIVAYYTFDSSTTIDSTGLHNATHVGSPTIDTTNKACGSGSLDTANANYLTMSYDAHFPNLDTEALSVCGWINGTDTALKRLYRNAKDTDPYTGWWLGIEANAHTPASVPYLQIYDTDAVAEYEGYDGNSDLNDGLNWTFVCYTYDGSGGESAQTGMTIYVNGNDETGSNYDTGNFNTMDTSSFIITFGGDALGGGINGGIDDLGIWNRELTSVEVDTLYNGGSCNQYPFTVEVNDTTAPSITNIKQDPANLTVLNAIVSHLKINATITDNIQLNNSTVILNWSAKDTRVYIAGVLQPYLDVQENYNHSIGDVFFWDLNENDFLSSTNNLPEDDFETRDHSNTTLTSANQYLKVRFQNVSNNATLFFSEIMDTNSSGAGGEYYYCNSSYTTGNIQSSPYCTVFFTQTGNDNIHVHGPKSFHRVMPLGLNTTTGEINGIGVTPTSYLLKRGTASGETYYHVANDTGTAETTLNQGVTWTARTYTVDMHIHQIGNETICYQISAEDNSSNSAISTVACDLIDYPILPPIPVSIYSPIEFNHYNGTIPINYSASFSITGQTITMYIIEYKKDTDPGWTELKDNNYPALTYSWDISEKANGNYSVRITVNDSLGLTAISRVDNVEILNDVTLNTQLLTDILSELQSLSALQERAEGDSTMLWIIIGLSVFLIAGALLKVPVLWAISGILSFLGGLKMGQIYLSNGQAFYQAGTWLFWIFGFALMIVGVGMQLLMTMQKNTGKDDIYGRLRY